MMREITFDFDIEILWAVKQRLYDYYVCRSGGKYFNIFKWGGEFHIEMAEENMIRHWGNHDLSDEEFFDVFGEEKQAWLEACKNRLEKGISRRFHRPAIETCSIGPFIVTNTKGRLRRRK